MKRAIITVRTWTDDGKWWGVFSRGNDTPHTFFRLKVDAVLYARRLARRSHPSQLVVKGRNGRIQYEHTYGADPKRHKG